MAVIRRGFFVAAVFAGGVCCAASAFAQDQIAVAWRTLAIADVDAMHQSVRALHPGMRNPETLDFPGRVDAAYRAARARAATAQDYFGWRDATQGFMLSFRDGHTIFRLNAAPTRFRWPGFLIDARADGYYVRRPAGVDSSADAPEGARVVSCDGTPIETLLKSTLDGVEADWSKEPERLRQAFRFFIDYRTEGPPRAQRCTFATSVGEVEKTLMWTPELWSAIEPALDVFMREMDHPIGKRVLADGGRWISLGSFSDEAQLGALAAALEQEQAVLRRARYVVFDVRGNRGGSSNWGETFASILYGKEATKTRALAFARSRQRVGKFWRASPEAERELRSMSARFAADGENYKSVAAYFAGIADLVRNAPQGDRALVEDPCCTPDASEPPSALAPLQYTRQVYVLTDAGCFSSCVLVVNELQRMGAIRVGETTGQNEEYGEITNTLFTPSGLGRYRLPLTIIRQDASDLRAPVDRRWMGAMDDDAGLEAWIGGMAHAQR